MEHEDQDMIFNTAGPATDSKALKTFNTANILTGKQILIDI